jgi:hypothetical protein
MFSSRADGGDGGRPRPHGAAPRARLLRMFDDLTSIAPSEKVPEIEAYRLRLGVAAGPDPAPR